METQGLRETLSQNIKKYRQTKGWSQFELAEKAEISEQTVNSIEGLRLCLAIRRWQKSQMF